MKSQSVRPVRMLVESAVLVAIGTILSAFPFSSPWALGGGITVCSMLPLVLIACRYPLLWSLFTAFVYSLFQLMMGASNVSYADRVTTAVLIVLFDYLLAFTVVGFSGVLFGRFGHPAVELVVGIVVTFLLRLGCHFVSGVVVWEVLWPNELGWAAPIWSLAYNASYMIPEIIITSVVAVACLHTPLRPYLEGKDLQR